MNALVRVRFIIFALILMLVSVTFAFAATSVPQDSESRAIFQVTDTATSVVTTTVQSTNTPTATLVVTPTATVTATITITLTPTITPTATPIPTRTPTGTPLPPATNPDSAREPNGAWAYLDPGATHWYKMNDTGLQLSVWIDANGQQGLSMAIFAPEQKDLYGRPIGRGSFNRSEAWHDLFWTGYTRAYGTWFAQVTNGASFPISYSLNYKRTLNSVAGRCSECHGFEIEWDRCVSHGSNWCENLKEEYLQKQ